MLWHFFGVLQDVFGTFLTSFGIFSDFQSGNPGFGAELLIGGNVLCNILMTC